MRNKNAGVGTTIVMFYSMILVVGILVLFFLGSGIANEFSDTKARVFIFNAGDIGIGDVYTYMTEKYLPAVSERIGVMENG
ncbi:MAG: hypothetical protein IH845_05620 [Nanoarchaeota archaeon]|nr:hypothetical protein [Nanoarchaeota archaeon]